MVELEIESGDSALVLTDSRVRGVFEAFSTIVSREKQSGTN